MEKAAEVLVRVKIDRIKRIDLSNSRHQFILDSITDQLYVMSDELIQGITDENIHVNLLNELVKKDGFKVSIFFYDHFLYVSKSWFLLFCNLKESVMKKKHSFLVLI